MIFFRSGSSPFVYVFFDQFGVDFSLLKTSKVIIRFAIFNIKYASNYSSALTEPLKFRHLFVEMRVQNSLSKKKMYSLTI